MSCFTNADPVCFLNCGKATSRSTLFFAAGFMGFWFVFSFSVLEKMGLFVGKDHLMFSLSLPKSAICPRVYLMDFLGVP